MSSQGSLLRSSIGKKAFMAVTGMLLCGFLVVHLLGNLALLLNDDGTLTLAPGGPESGAWFKWVAHHYEVIPAMFHLGEVILLALFGAHILLAVTLWLQNRAARGSRYAVHRSEGGRTFASATMPYTGLFVILVFLVIHLLNFRFGEQASADELYVLVARVLGYGAWAAVYVVALVGLGIHLSHGVQSAFQSLGLNHPRVTPKIKLLGTLFAIAVPAGFALLPVLFVLHGGAR